MKPWRALIFAGLLLTIAACRQPRRDAEDLVRTIGPLRLRQDAAVLYKNVFAARDSGFTAIKDKEWPPSFQRLAPRSVGAYLDGFALSLDQPGEAECGLYIVPLQMDHRPANSQHARFERLDDGIYWYVFKK